MGLTLSKIFSDDPISPIAFRNGGWKEPEVKWKPMPRTPSGHLKHNAHAESKVDLVAKNKNLELDVSGLKFTEPCEVYPVASGFVERGLDTWNCELCGYPCGGPKEQLCKTCKPILRDRTGREFREFFTSVDK